MFKNITPHIITSTLPDFVTLEKALQQMPFDITTGQETKSVGWVPPRSDGGLFVESVNSQLIMRFMAETRQVPASVVQSRVDEMVSEWEATTGRKPGKKERRDLKEQAVAELLPNAFPRKLSDGVMEHFKAQVENEALKAERARSGLAHRKAVQEAVREALQEAQKACENLPAPESCSGIEKSLWDVATMACSEAILARYKE